MILPGAKAAAKGAASLDSESSDVPTDLSELLSEASSEKELSDEELLEDDLDDYRDAWEAKLPWFASSGSRGKIHWKGTSYSGDATDSMRGRWPCTTFLSPSAVAISGEGITTANASGVLVWCASCRRSLLRVFPEAQGYLA